ncbi:protein of unknown function [Arenibacter nanhaiticus]|uniref:DUF4271 domain-containing protein n=1 Tax=Arenibacter nanhaiticus TaxID=558155 RepID=A0A1M6JNZ1_9FLAO|nr:DUF4271 domain-containing protein [Arenibacter nanhaiticus]SHJ48421.1 protein of unknown function [Arenibacter nanhaiticus]
MEPILRTPYSIDWITAVIFTSIVFMILAKSSFYSRFMNFIILPFNNKYIFLYSKKDKIFSGFNLFFSLFQILNSALLIYFAYHIYYDPFGAHEFKVYGFILMALLLFLTSKIFLQIANGFIFNSKSIISEIIFKKLTYLNYSSLLMLMANLLLNFVYKQSKTILIISFILILLIHIMGWITALRNHQKFIASNFVYFILYLCALEIAPLLIIWGCLKD